VRRCKKCGRLNPQFAVGTVVRRGSDRLLVYEGSSPKPFTYQASDECMVCRHGGTRGTLSKAPVVGRALKAWLIKVNAREEVTR
jgi:hypothetical protein